MSKVCEKMTSLSTNFAYTTIARRKLVFCENRTIFFYFRHYDKVKTKIAQGIDKHIRKPLNKVHKCLDVLDLRLYCESLSRSSPQM